MKFSLCESHFSCYTITDINHGSVCDVGKTPLLICLYLIINGGLRA